MKLGFIGAGFIARFQALAIEQVRGLEIAGLIRRRNSEAFAQFCRGRGLGEARIYDSIGEMANHVDVIAIYVPNYARIETMEQVVAAVKAGAALKGVILEKPLGRNLKEARRLVELAREAKLNTAYFENQIYMRAIQTQRDQLLPVMRSMGPLTLTRSAEEHGGPHEPWFWDPTTQGGGVCCDMGCHSIACGMYMVTPFDKPVNYLKPVRVNATMALLKWGKEPWRSQLKQRGVDYSVAPAEDYSSVSLEFEDPQTGMPSIVQATNSWMYDAPGLRLLMETFGPGYSYTVNSLESPVGVFISDAAAAAVLDSELALEKSQATRGALILQPDEIALYGYVAEWADALQAFEGGRDALLNLEYGKLITTLIMAAYMSHEKRKVIDMTDPRVLTELDSYVPLIQQGKGKQVL